MLGAKGETEDLNLRWTDSKSKQSIKSQQISLQVGDASGQRYFNMWNVRTVPDLQMPVQTVKMNDLERKWSHLTTVRIPPQTKAKPTVLIGQDNCHLIVSREVIEGPRNAPVLSRTSLGWILHGNVGLVNGRVDEVVALHVRHQSEDDDELHRLVKDSFKVESLGVKILEKPLVSEDDRRATEIFDATSRRVGDRWETGLLWKEKTERLPESRFMALKRLKNLERKFDRDSDLAVEYGRKIDDYVAKGYARKLSQNELKVDHPRTWYLPHFPVVNPNKEEKKVRLVFDAAAKVRNKSLNDFLLQGADILNALPSVLFKFRQERIGFCADIVEMFHQVMVIPEDHPAQRFLWRGSDRSKEPDVYEMNVMTFGATCSPFLANETRNRNTKEFEGLNPEAVRAIIDRHYVDDYLDSKASEREASELIADVVEIQRRGGFVLRG